jgi:XTP/dITP diphosphohydrolase
VSDAVMSIVVATANAGKLAEIRAMLSELPVEVLSAAEALGAPLTVVEDGDTFEANARKKANAVARATMMVTLADDSGLEVDALGGRPGVRSARFAHEGATDAENNASLLKQLQDIDDEARTARFRCAMVLIDPWSAEQDLVVEGRCEGRVAHKPSGSGGFGYDPLFIVDESGRTMADLSENEKNAISHRAKALGQMQPKLKQVIRARLSEAATLLGGAEG